MADIDIKIQDVYQRISKERKILDGFQQVRAASKNPVVISSAEAKIRESQRSISYFEESLHELQLQKAASHGNAGVSHGPPGRSSGIVQNRASSGMGPEPAIPMRGKGLREDPLRNGGAVGRDPYALGNKSALPVPAVQTHKLRPRIHYTNLDLIKQDTPYTTAKISRMLHQLEFKLQVENQYKEGINKMIKLYSTEGDRKSRSDAEAKRLESAQKIALLKAALQRYKTLHILDDADLEDEAGSSGDSVADRRGNLRRPLTGKLELQIKAVRDIDHAPLTASRSRYPTETSVIVKIEDVPKAKSHPSRNDRWNEDITLDVDKANEIEILLYDKAGPEPPVPVGMVWIRISDVVEELRRKKVGMESGPGWVTAANVNTSNPILNPGLTSASQTTGGMEDIMSQNDRKAQLGPGSEGSDGIETWFAVEPAGAILLRINFVKENARKRPLETGLGRQGAVKKKKEEVHEMNGHQFVQRQFYQIMTCALCSEFLLNAAGYQCEDCNYTCHKKCYPKVVTKCISKSSSETDQDEEQLRHKIPHRFEPLTNIGANWCCHCGYILPLGRKNARKCSECNITCHTDCTHLVPDFCGMSMETANQLLRDMKAIKSKQQTQKTSLASSFSGSSVSTQPSSIVPPMLDPDFGRLSLDAQPDSRLSTSHQMVQQGRPALHPQKSFQDGQTTDRRPLPQPRKTSGYPETGSRPSTAQMASSQVSSQSINASQSNAKDYVAPKYTLDGIELDPARAPSSIAAANMNGFSAPNTGVRNTPSRPLPSTHHAQAQGQPRQPSHSNIPDPRSYSAQTQESYPLDQTGSKVTGSYGQNIPAPRTKQSQQPSLGILGQPGYPPNLGQTKLAGKLEQQPSSSRAPLSTSDQRHGSQNNVSSQQKRLPSQSSSRPDVAPNSKHREYNIPSALRSKIGLDDFNFLAVLGKGNFGKVMLAEDKQSKALYAIKVLKKEFIIENDEVESTRSEKRIFLAANRERHPFLIGLHSCFQTETRVYFVMEYVAGGDLMLHIQREQFTPQRAQYYAAEVLLALEYFHRNGIIYRDLKLDNILLTMEGHIKVADYGLCKEDMWHGKSTGTFCGTPEFMAPEILLEQRYGRAVDWWAFGVLIYELLLGQSPFKGDDEDEIFDAILEDEPLYPIQMPRDSVSILQSLLTRNPAQRLGSGSDDAEEIKRHPFFRNVDWTRMLNKSVPPPFLPTIGSPTDVSNFDSEFTSEQPRLTPIHSRLTGADQAEFNGFSYISSWAAQGNV